MAEENLGRVTLSRHGLGRLLNKVRRVGIQIVKFIETSRRGQLVGSHLRVAAIGLKDIVPIVQDKRTVIFWIPSPELNCPLLLASTKTVPMMAGAVPDTASTTRASNASVPSLRAIRACVRLVEELRGFHAAD